MMKVLRWIHRGLLAVARAVGRVNTFLLLTLSFYLILLPLSLLHRIFAGRKEESGWLPKEPLPPDHFKRQY